MFEKDILDQRMIFLVCFVQDYGRMRLYFYYLQKPDGFTLVWLG